MSTREGSVWLVNDAQERAATSGTQQAPFQITGNIPKQHGVQEFSPDRPNQALHERV